MTITVTDFKTHCLRILREVEHTNKPIEISKQGKVRFRIIPVHAPDMAPWMRLRSHGILHGQPGESVFEESDWEASR